MLSKLGLYVLSQLTPKHGKRIFVLGSLYRYLCRRQINYDDWEELNKSLKLARDTRAIRIGDLACGYLFNNVNIDLGMGPDELCTEFIQRLPNRLRYDSSNAIRNDMKVVIGVVQHKHKHNDATHTAS